MTISQVHPIVRDRLLKSGHYHKSQGLIRSKYFPHPSISHHGDFGFVHSSLIAGNGDSLQKGSNSVIKTSLYSKGARRIFAGLESCVRIEELGSLPIYVIDNHQMAFFAWHEALAMGYIQRGSSLIHIDAHDDNLRPKEWHSSNELEKTADYVKNILNVEDFIMPAVENGLINEFWNFQLSPPMHLMHNRTGVLEYTTETTKLLRENPLMDKTGYCTGERCRLAYFMDPKMGSKTYPKKMVLDIDLDAFVKESYDEGKLPTPDDFSEAAKFLAEIAKGAGVVTIATSPCFADQDAAIIAAKRIVQEIINRTNN
jgi:hypothetical protein